MRRNHCRLSAAAVTTTLCTHLIGCLHLRDYHRSVPARLLARLLLLCAATKQSLSFHAQHCAKAPSDEAVRLALKYNLPITALALLALLLTALHGLLPARVLKRPRPCALDLHQRPYYGDRHTPGISGGKHEAGTDYFWCYATLAVLSHGLRFNVGLCTVDRRQSLATTVRTLLEQAKQAGVRIQWLLLDRGFYDAQVILALQKAGVPFAMPALRRGDASSGSGTQRFFRRDCAAGWYDYSWVARPRQRDPKTGKKSKQPGLPVSARVCVVRPTAGGKPWVFLAWGLNWDGALLARRYKGRFGIETSYRQLGQCLANTTSKDERVRLLYVGLALLLRQYWAWAHATTLARQACHGRRHLQSHLLRLECLNLWLLYTLMRWLRFRLDIPTPIPVPNFNES